MVKWGDTNLKLTSKIRFKYNIKYSTDFKYWLTFYLDAPANIITKLFENVIKQRDPTLSVEVPDEFIVPADMYSRIVNNKRIRKYVKDVEKQMQSDMLGFRIITVDIKENGFRYRKEGNLYKVTIELQGDYTS